MENTTTPKPDDAQSTTVTMALMCRLTEAELEEESRKLTELLVEKSDLEVAKSSSNKHYTDRIKAMEVKIENQIPIVRDREIEREVECRVDYNTPEAGRKRITRLDTNELVEEREMTDAEKQDLFINAGKQETEADAEVVEERDVIHVDLDCDNHEEITPEVGRVYEINGEKFVATDATNKLGCNGCAFCDDDTDHRCRFFDCDDFHFKPYEESSPDNGESSEPNGESTEEVPVSEEAQTIHVSFDDYHEQITPVEGQLYEIKGILCRAVASPANNCEQCIFDDTPNAPLICPKFDCENFIFVHAEGESAPLVCSKCGLALKKLYHTDKEKLMCEHCMENTSSAKRAAQFLAADRKEFSFRAQFGYGCREEFADATCFRFRNPEVEGGACWGMNHYKAGDYRVEGTPAHDYMKFLKDIGGVEG